MDSGITFDVLRRLKNNSMELLLEAVAPLLVEALLPSCEGVE